MPTLQQTFNDAEQCREQGDLARAEQLYRQILALDPGFHAAYHGLALLAHTVGRAELAIAMLKNAITLDDTVPLYHGNLCEMNRRAGLLEEAIAAGRTAVSLRPGNPDFKYNLALAYADQQDYPAAIKFYRELLELNPGHGLACNNLGTALEKTGEVDAALGYYRKAVQIDPDHAEAQNNLGAIYSERGQLDEARACFSAAIRAKPDFIEPYYNISALKTFTVRDPHFTGLKKLSRDVASWSAGPRIRYYFALGKAYEDVAEYNDAFKAYQDGNRLKFAQIRYNDDQANRLMQRIRSVFTRALFEEKADQGIMDDSPIFIVGMPRSGTSLIEQILASHHNIHGAGELAELHEVIRHAHPGIDAGRIFEVCEPGLPGFDLPAMAQSYLDDLRRYDANAGHITDKMPANFFYIGFIHLMFPRARIIHAMRNPMDSCFSCYARLFNETMEFAYDLDTLGYYYIRYMQLMEHWHSVLPPGRILDVVYEDMVADVEGQTRRMLEYIGEPWDDDCLAFYTNKRQVKTASVAQVRKPIYNTSVARWRHFEKQLQPLMRIVHGYCR